MPRACSVIDTITELPQFGRFSLASYLLAYIFLSLALSQLPQSHYTHSPHNTTMSDNERPRDRYRERDSRREPREDRKRGGTPTDRRNRSRSPRRERGGRRSDNNRYRSRSPIRRDDRDRDGAREPRGRGRGGDRDRDNDRDDRRRDAPRGPRGGASAPSGPRRSDFAPRGGPVKPPSAPREIVTKEESPDVEMKEDAQKPDDMDEDTWQMKKMMGFAGFKSTKNTKVPGNDKNYGVRKDKQMEARQYMNRQGGFNRPLSPSRG